MQDNVRDRTAFLVIAGPGDPVTPRWKFRIEESLSAGEEVHLYLVDRAVLNLIGGDPIRTDRERLRLYACAYGARRYDVPLMGPVVFAGLTVLSHLIVGCTKFISVAPSRSGGDIDGVIDPSFSMRCDRRGPFDEIVVYIRWNPRESHLPVEGLRIASGLTVTGASIEVCLSGEATSILELPPDEIVDGERRDAYLEVLGKNEARFYLMEDSAGGMGCVDGSRYIDREEMRGITSKADRLIII